MNFLLNARKDITPLEMAKIFEIYVGLRGDMLSDSGAANRIKKYGLERHFYNSEEILNPAKMDSPKKWWKFWK